MKSLVILAIFAVSLKAFAFIENRHLFPMGDAEMMMANTGIALKASSGNAFFNPAGLAQLKQRRLSLSGNTYMRHTVDVKPALVVDDRDVNLSSAATQAVPSSVISTLPWKDFTFGFGVFVPEQLRTTELSQLDTPAYDVQLSRSFDQQLLLIGLSAGGTIAKVDAGAGCFFGMFTSAQTITMVGMPKAGSGIANPSQVSTYRNISARMIFCQVGAQKDVADATRVGAVLRLPSMSLEGSAEFWGFQRPSNPTTTTPIANSGIQKRSAKYEVPTELAVGVAHRFGPRAQALADLAYQFGGTFSPVDGEASWEIAGTLRWNAGMEYLLTDAHVLRAGYGFNPSSFVMKTDGDIREDYSILTAGYEYREAQSTLGLGLFSAASSGSSRVNADRRGSVSTRATAVLITTGFVF